jgi:response regulator RpfG family c-di-GMP phosphodiesterase
MRPRILCVDDEIGVLAVYQAQLAKDFEIIPALGGAEGLATIQASGPFPVIVSDMRMPGMDGAEFLAKARSAAPESVRVLLTAHAEIQTAMAAVNEGRVFRFLTKPCPADTLRQVLQSGVEQYRLVIAEKELLEKTLHGSIKALTDVLAVVNPLAFGRASRVQRLVKHLAVALGIANTWEFEVAALLSQLGCVTLPEPLLVRAYAGEELTPQERQMIETHSRQSHDLLADIPRLETVVESIACRDHRFDGQGLPPTTKKGSELPLGARLLKVALDLDSLEGREHSRAKAIQRVKGRVGWYDPAILEVLEMLPDDQTQFATRYVRVLDLRRDMILGQDVRTSTGILLVRKGQEITGALLHRLRNYATHGRIEEPIVVQVPS